MFGEDTASPKNNHFTGVMSTNLVSLKSIVYVWCLTNEQ
jgi:hypothetical protein